MSALIELLTIGRKASEAMSVLDLKATVVTRGDVVVEDELDPVGREITRADWHGRTVTIVYADGSVGTYDESMTLKVKVGQL